MFRVLILFFAFAKILINRHIECLEVLIFKLNVILITKFVIKFELKQKNGERASRSIPQKSL